MMWRAAAPLGLILWAASLCPAADLLVPDEYPTIQAAFSAAEVASQVLPTVADPLSGDVSGDGTLSLVDVNMLKDHLLGLASLQQDALDRADSNEDDRVDAADMVHVLNSIRASSGAPTTWSSPAPLDTNAAGDSGDDWNPQVTTDGTGHWVAVWHSYDSLGGAIGTDPDILVSRSADHGATWTPPAALNTNAADDSGWDLVPQVTTDGAGHWVAVWYLFDPLGGTIGPHDDILVSRSTDHGATWTPPAALTTNAAGDSGSDRDPQVTTDGAGHRVAVWWSEDSLGGTIGMDADILVSRSADHGATWTPPAALNTNAAGDSGYDSDPQVTTDGAGSWVAVWLSGTIGTDLDILVSRSTDHGATWTPPAALNTNAARDSGDDWHPQVTTDGAGHWVAVWESYDSLGGAIGTDLDILVSHSPDHGATWTPPAALNTNAAGDSGDDLHPQVTTDGAGHWVAAWESYDSLGGAIGTDWDILVSHSTDHGATWTPPAALNANAARDLRTDFDPQVTTDGAGHWVAVWQSSDSLGGTIGLDWDILVSTSSTVPSPPLVTPGLDTEPPERER